MAFIFLDQKTLGVSVVCATDEAFTPDEELKVIKQKSDDVKKDYEELTKKMNEIIGLCNEWNKKHLKESEEKKPEV